MTSPPPFSTVASASSCCALCKQSWRRSRPRTKMQTGELWRHQLVCIRFFFSLVLVWGMTSRGDLDGVMGTGGTCVFVSLFDSCPPQRTSVGGFDKTAAVELNRVTSQVKSSCRRVWRLDSLCAVFGSWVCLYVVCSSITGACPPCFFGEHILVLV